MLPTAFVPPASALAGVSCLVARRPGLNKVEDFRNGGLALQSLKCSQQYFPPKLVDPQIDDDIGCFLPRVAT
jgi:hypothetical protein